MRDEVLEILSNAERSLLFEEIDSLLDIKSIEETQELVKVLNELEENGDVYKSNKNKYMSFDMCHLKKGRLSGNRNGYGFVKVVGLEDDIYINASNMNDALDGDTVVVEVISTNNKGETEGRIVRILKRGVTAIVGEISFKKEIGYVVPDDKKLNFVIEIPKSKNKGSVDGHKVLVKIIDKDPKGRYKGEVIEIIGHKNDVGVDILSIVYKYNIKTEFDSETLTELDSVSEEVSEDEKIGRTDLTNEMIFTIDGDDTKDIDDAISIEKLENGNYKLGVHIADVSYYVKEGTAIDNEAMERGTSVYLVDRVIPMLPHKLSNGICSLNPEVERLSISCVMEIDEKGRTVNYDIFPSVIKSRIQMTYKKANKIVEEGIIPEGYEPYSDKLLLMKELSLVIRKAKDERGFIDFDVDEAKILVDDNGEAIDVVLRDRGVAEKIIEDFMIQANECVATHIFYMELPFVYRVHEYPKEESIKEFLSFLSSLGYSVPGDVKGTNPKAIQTLLKFLHGKKEFKILSSLLLRKMQKAVYLPQNLGHYGLASKCYTHFTSPIRRYPDTTVHRLLRTYLFNSDISTNTVGHWQEKLVYIAENSSLRERNSIECEREVDDMKMAEYMEKHVGEEFKGMIASIVNFGMFIQLENLIEGLVHVNDLNDYFKYDELTQTLTGEKTGMKYTLGDEVMVKCVRASKEEKQIDFEIIKKL